MKLPRLVHSVYVEGQKLYRNSPMLLAVGSYGCALASLMLTILLLLLVEVITRPLWSWLSLTIEWAVTLSTCLVMAMGVIGILIGLYGEARKQFDRTVKHTPERRD
jgi:Mg2+/Co2+ transporter CorB